MILSYGNWIDSCAVLKIFSRGFVLLLAALAAGSLASENCHAQIRLGSFAFS